MITNKKIIEIDGINKSYYFNKKQISVLSNLKGEFEKGKLYVIMGHSGSGKSTLINILGLIDSFDNGQYYLNSENVKNLSDKELSFLRMKHIGFIYQNYQLSDTLKAIENVILPMIINKDINKKDRYNKAKELLDSVGLSNRLYHYPKELSGGEQQRVAIARALANNPLIILADEPTGNLDKKMEKEIFAILRRLADEGKCVIIVSHSESSKEYADVVLNLDEGKLSGDTR